MHRADQSGATDFRNEDERAEGNKDSMLRLRTDSARSGADDQTNCGEVPPNASGSARRTQELAPLPPDLMRIRRYLETRSELALDGAEFVSAFGASELARTIGWLVEENGTLAQSLHCAQDDFEAQRTINAELERQLLDVLAAADDSRIGLMEALERASDELLAREAEIVELRELINETAAQSRAVRASLEAECLELRERLGVAGRQPELLVSCDDV